MAKELLRSAVIFFSLKIINSTMKPANQDTANFFFNCKQVPFNTGTLNLEPRHFRSLVL